MIKKFLQKIFKKISYYLFTKIYGKIEKSIQTSSDNRIKTKVANFEAGQKYNIYKVNNGRLYTDRVHDTAIILDNNIIDGPSFQLRDNNNSSVSNNIVFKKGTQRKLRKLNGAVLSLLTGGGGNDNYWHWLYDVLPRIKLCEKVKKLDEIDYFLLPNLEKKFQLQTLNELNIDKKKLLSSVKFRHIKVEELIVTDHPYNLTNDSHNDVQRVPVWIIDWLREKFLNNLKKSQKKYPKKIYIDRSDSKSNVSHLRSIINEDEVKKILIKENFHLVRLNDLNFIDQVQYFNSADYIVGLHGAGFANLSFCRANTKVLEFRTNTTGKMYENLANLNRLKFDSIICKAQSHSYAKHLGHIEVSLNILREKINDA